MRAFLFSNNFECWALDRTIKASFPSIRLKLLCSALLNSSRQHKHRQLRETIHLSHPKKKRKRNRVLQVQCCKKYREGTNPLYCREILGMYKKAFICFFLSKYRSFTFLHVRYVEMGVEIWDSCNNPSNTWSTPMHQTFSTKI